MNKIIKKILYTNMQLVNIQEIKNNENNPRIIKDYKFKQLVKSIKEFPEMLKLRPIVVNSEMIVLGGNMRLKACKEAGLKEVWILKADELTEEQQREFIVKDNVGFGEWDWDVLANEWNNQQLEDWGLDLLPFEEEDVLEAEEDDFDTTPPEIAKTVLGDLYEIGEHRLLCGDSTDSDQVAKLMNGEKADMVFTSPPYNANTSMITHDKKGKSIKSDFYQNNESDNKSSIEYINFLSDVLNNCILNTKGHIFWNISYNPNSRSEWLENTYNFKEYLQEVIIWKKSSAMPVKYGFTRNIEFIFLYSTEGLKNYITNINEIQYNFWEVSNNNSSIENHKACFPIELVSKALNINKKNNLILEPFLGSGSTMVASHQLKRKCYGMELDPKYCDVIVKRMIKLDDTLTIKRNGIDCTNEWK
jgi:DNA modification methylase